MTTNTEPPLADLAREVRIASQALTRRVKENTLGLAPHLFTVLVWLEAGPATAADLAGHERVSAPSMSKTVGELEERGYVARQTDPTDARANIVTLTPSGRRAVAQAGHATTGPTGWPSSPLRSRTCCATPPPSATGGQST
jgi:DNA-binding HxlR family transcriptional regulator